MAKATYFHLVHAVTAIEHLVRAPKEKLAIALVAGDRSTVKPATDDQIVAHTTAGLALHANSVAEGAGKLFFIPGDPNVIIRAKNAGEAFGLVNNGAWTATKVSQDTLVHLLTVKKLVPQIYEEPGANAGTTATSGESAGSETSTATSTPEAGATPHGDDAAEADATSEAPGTDTVAESVAAPAGDAEPANESGDVAGHAAAA